MAEYVLQDVRLEMGGAVVASGTNAAVIIGPLDLSRYPTRTITVYNMGTVTLSGAVVQVNPDPNGAETGSRNERGQQLAGPNPGFWIDYDTASLQSIGSGQLKGTTLPGQYRWWRVIATNNQTASTTASGYLCAGSMV